MATVKRMRDLRSCLQIHLGGGDFRGYFYMTMQVIAAKLAVSDLSYKCDSAPNEDTSRFHSAGIGKLELNVGDAKAMSQPQQTPRSKSVSKERGPYKTAKQGRETPALERTYFKEEHARAQPKLSFAQPYQEEKRVKVQYRVEGEKKIHIAPSALTSWLTGLSVEEQRNEIKLWKDRLNEDRRSLQTLYPSSFIKHEKQFLSWLNRTADVPTVDAYYTDLGRFVFPFFVGKCGETNVRKWVDHYPQFRRFLMDHFGSKSSVNRVIGASRRYLKFLMYQGIYSEGSLQVMVNEVNKRDQREGKILPGELPDWSDIAAYLSSMEPSYFRWLLILCASFGIRISEAFAVVPSDLIGKAAIDKEKNTFVASINERHKPIAFLDVSKAEKVKPKNKIVAAQLGEADDDPKSGPYYAACLSGELGTMIVEALKRGECNRPAGTTLYSIRNHIEKLPHDGTAVLFHEWKTHDFRRCHITLTALAWGSFGDVAEAHGQASEATARRYFQWGLAMKRSKDKLEFELNV